MKGLFFTFGMTFGGAAASLFRPFVGLLVYLSFSILKPNYLWGYAIPRWNYSRIVFIALLLGWAIAGFGTWRLGKAKGILIALVIFLAWMTLSAFGAADQRTAWDVGVWQITKVVLGVLVGVSLIDSMKRVEQLTWVLVLSLAYLAYEFNTSYYFGDNRLELVGFAGMDDKGMATTMVIGAAMALFMALASPHVPLKILAFVASALMMHVPLFVHSRGGMLGLAVAGFVAFLFVPKRPFHLVVFGLALFVGFSLAGPEVRQQFASTFADEDARDRSAESRLILWGQALDTISQHPITGIGPRQWKLYSTTQLDWDREKEVHNTWLQIGAEVGIPGLIAFLMFFGLAGFHVFRIRNTAPPGSPDRLYARMVIVALASFAVVSQFITIYGIETPYYVVMIGAGLLKMAHQQRPAVVHPQVVKPIEKIPIPQTRIGARGAS